MPQCSSEMNRLKTNRTLGKSMCLCVCVVRELCCGWDGADLARPPVVGEHGVARLVWVGRCRVLARREYCAANPLSTSDRWKIGAAQRSVGADKAYNDFLRGLEVLGLQVTILERVHFVPMTLSTLCAIREF